MIGAYETVAERRRSTTEAWVALIFDEPELVRCPACDGTGIIPTFGGHGFGRIPTECGWCEGAGEVRKGDLP